VKVLVSEQRPQTAIATVYMLSVKGSKDEYGWSW